MVRALQRSLIPSIAQTPTQPYICDSNVGNHDQRSIKARFRGRYNEPTSFHTLYTSTYPPLWILSLSDMSQLLHLVARQVAADGGNEGTIQVPIAGTPGHCDSGNEYNGDLGLRISAIFVIMVGSLLGMRHSPIMSRKYN